MIFTPNKKITNYTDTIIRLENINAEFNNLNIVKKNVKTLTFQITEDCNLECTYCYQINKSNNTLSFEYAKQFIDLLIADSYKSNSYVSIDTTIGVIVEFIGGEPLMEIGLMDTITDYFYKRLIEENHIWVKYFRVGLISNGMLYFNNNVQDYFKKNKGLVSFGISLDGNKKLHDTCRLLSTGEGSYDIAVKGCKHYMENYDENMYTKMTFAPENINYTYDAITNLIELGYKAIHCNPIYEDKWNNRYAGIYYHELKRVANHIIENNLYNDIELSVFDGANGKVDLVNDNKNYCGSTGSMLALDYRGNIYPCIRFMPSSLGDKIEPFKIGDIWNGISITYPDRDKVNILDSVTYTSQSDDECINCNISIGCGWCTANNYQITGSVNKRVKTICGMHKAKVLANVYYWNMIYKKGNYDNDPFEMNIPKEWALEIISEEEYNILVTLSSK